MPKVKAKRTIYTGGKLVKKGETFSVPQHKLNHFTDKQIEKVDSDFKNRKTKSKPEIEQPGEPLAEKTVDELTDIAREAGLEGYSRMKKAELIAAIKKVQ